MAMQAPIPKTVGKHVQGSKLCRFLLHPHLCPDFALPRASRLAGRGIPKVPVKRHLSLSSDYAGPSGRPFPGPSHCKLVGVTPPQPVVSFLDHARPRSHLGAQPRASRLAGRGIPKVPGAPHAKSDTAAQGVQVDPSLAPPTANSFRSNLRNQLCRFSTTRDHPRTSGPSPGLRGWQVTEFQKYQVRRMPKVKRLRKAFR